MTTVTKAAAVTFMKERKGRRKKPTARPMAQFVTVTDKVSIEARNQGTKEPARQLVATKSDSTIVKAANANVSTIANQCTKVALARNARVKAAAACPGRSK